MNSDKQPNIDTFINDDYTALDVKIDGKRALEFYFGYEVEEDDEWCFTASENGKEVMRIKASELSSNNEEIVRYLLIGIGKYLLEKNKDG